MSATPSSWLGGETPRSTARNTEELAGIGIGVSKKDRKDLHDKDKKTYYKIRDNAIQGMESKFSLLESIDEKNTMDHLSSVYSIVTRLDELRTHLGNNDMLDVFTIPSAFDKDPQTSLYSPSSTAKPVNLFTDAGSVTLETVKLANSYFLRYGASYHGENVSWSGQKILDSCDTTLKDKLIESTRTWDKSYIGGPTYLKLLSTLVMSTSEKSLRTLTQRLSTLSITDFDGENVSKAVSFIRGAILILRDNKALPADITMQVLQIFKKSTCEPFRLHVTNIDSFIELRVKTYTLDELMTNIDSKYIELLSRNEWTAKSTTNSQASGFTAFDSSLKKVICFNCGGLHHVVSECPHPRDNAAIELRKELMSKYGTTAKPTSNSTGTNEGNKQKDPFVQPPRPGEPREKTINGKTYHWCGKVGCKRWTDHSTITHDTYMQNKGASKPSGHLAGTPDDASSVTTDTNGQTPGDKSDGTPSTSDTASGLLSSAYHFG